MTRHDFTDALTTYCNLLGGSVTSSLRTIPHNKNVGGVEHSAHLYGLAADVTYDAHTDLTHALDVAERLGLHLIREGDHDHLQPLDWKAG